MMDRQASTVNATQPTGNTAMENELVQLLPKDEHNRELEAHVHPPEWTNPTPNGTYHLVVIGAGTAGLVTAAGAAGLGARVALIERELVGGDCLNVGCVPSKTVIRAARVAATVRDCPKSARRFIRIQHKPKPFASWAINSTEQNRLLQAGKF